MGAEFEILPGQVALDREIASRGLLGFMRVAWDQVERGSPFVGNWHIDCVADYLEAVSRNEIRRLILNIPPGCMKSLAVSVFWPSWEWCEVDPALRHIFVTYSDRLSRRDAVRMRDLIMSPWFQARWPHITIPTQNTRSAKMFKNSEGGFRFSTTIKGGLTGEHGHRLNVDDPVKPRDTIGSRAALGTELDNVIDWWKFTASTRGGADPKRFANVIIMQRLHERDLVGHLETEEDGWTIVKIPMRWEGKAFLGPLGEDPRTEEGELLWPERFDEPAVQLAEERLGPRGTAAQNQQRPSPAGGAIFKREWFGYWGAPGCKYLTLPARRREVQIWDMSFKGKPRPGKKRSFVCGQVWAQIGADMLLIGQERGQWGFVDQQAAVRRLTGRFPRAHRKYIEDAANGAAIVNSMRGSIPGLKLVPTGGGSEARAEAASISFESGNVYFPHPSIASWVGGLEDELLVFPMGRWDDQVDCVSHAVVKMAESTHASYAKAMKALSKTGSLVS